MRRKSVDPYVSQCYFCKAGCWDPWSYDQVARSRSLAKGGDNMVSGLATQLVTEVHHIVPMAASTSTPALPDSSTMWDTIATGSGSFLTGIVTPLFNMCASNAIILLFLSVSFVKMGVKVLGRMIGAFGRGR